MTDGMLDIKDHIQVIFTPEEGSEREEHDHELDPDTLMWVYTRGLIDFDRPELEIRNVPLIATIAWGAVLNQWAAYSVKVKEIKAGEAMLERSRGLDLLLRASDASDKEFWRERGRRCLEFKIERAKMACAECAKG